MPKSRKILLFFAVSSALIAALCLVASHVIEQSASERVFVSTKEVPVTRVALVLGCAPRLSNGRLNPFFENRVQAASTLWRSGKCSRLLVSGDNHRRSYDEPTAMLQRLMEIGVPQQAIVLDYAGFSTFDSIARAQRVFDLEQICIVTQAEHAKRALFLADHIGIQAIAYEANDVGFRYGVRTQLREVLARVRALLDVTILNRKPHFLGPKIVISQNAASPATGTRLVDINPINASPELTHEI